MLGTHLCRNDRAIFSLNIRLIYDLNLLTVCFTALQLLHPLLPATYHISIL